MSKVYSKTGSSFNGLKCVKYVHYNDVRGLFLKVTKFKNNWFVIKFNLTIFTANSPFLLL